MANFRAPQSIERLFEWAGQTVRQLNRQLKYTTFGEVTLELSASSTVVSDSSVRAGSVVHLTPATAAAATALTTTFIEKEFVSTGRFTISHASNSTTDRTFTYSVSEPNERTR